MAPSLVLLNRQVFIAHDAAVFDGADERGAGGAGEERRGPPNPEEMREAILPYLRTVKPDARFADPPELSSLRILRPAKSIPPLCEGVTSCFIASADKNWVALYAGRYRPGTNWKGCYLIYDAVKNSLSTIPRVPCDSSHDGLGFGAVVIQRQDVGGEDAYLLVELTMVKRSDPPQAALWMWRSSAAEWVMKVGRLPIELRQLNDIFVADMFFSFKSGSIVCWADMFKGMVACDLRPVEEHGSDPVFCFIPLPCQTYNHGHRKERPLLAQEFRSIACVGGAVKFVTMDGYYERPGNEVKLITWTLLPDLSGWKQSKVYSMVKLWANKTHLSMGFSQLIPKFPVLSMHEDGVVYLVFNDVRLVNGQQEYRGQYLLRLDMQHNEVKYHPVSTERIHAQLFASECSAHLQGYEGHQRKRSKVDGDK